MVHSENRLRSTDKKTSILFTVDWEDYFNALYPPDLWWDKEELVAEPTYWLLDELKLADVKAIFYILGHTKLRHKEVYEAIVDEGHVIGSHGYYHRHDEWEPGLFRSPYWDRTPMPGWSGGFFFRFLPYALFKNYLEKSGVFWIHPHDILLEHPKLRNPVLNFKRQYGLKESRQKLRRVLNDFIWRNPGSKELR